MQLFDEYGNCVGEFYKDSIEDVKDYATDTISDGGWLWGLILLLIIFPGWTILGGIIYLVCKLVWFIVKLALNTAWWIVRLPFTLLFRRELPEF